ncbi:MAG: hypothetical protein AB8F26_10035, partial [Phycisphaerales bacterium]
RERTGNDGERAMKKLLVMLVLLLGLLAVIAVAIIVITPRVTRFDPIKVAGDALTGYGANSDRHKNAQQLPTPWDPVGDANRRVEAIPMEDRAYPLIAEAAAMMEAEEVRDKLKPKPGEEGWEEAVVWVESDEAQAIIRVLERAVAKPEAGFPMSDAPEPIWEAARERHGLKADVGQASPYPMVFDVLLPATGKVRLMVRLLSVDSEIAFEQSDADRFVRNLETTIGLVKHGYEQDWLIQQLVDYAALALVREQIERVLIDLPSFLDEVNAARLALACSVVDTVGVYQLGTSNEIETFEDQIRRYVDDRGVYDVQGAGAVATAMGSGNGLVPPSSVATASINQDLLASLTEFQRWAAVAERAATEPYEAMTGFKPETEAWAKQADSVPGSIGRLLFSTFIPAWPKVAATNRIAQQQSFALRLALAAHRHRLRHGDPPLGLADIDDDLITFDPIDGFTGGPMQFRWRDGAPFVYTYGPDKDDDGGRHVLDEEGEPWMTISDELLEAVPDGDYVLFPSQNE